MAPWRVHWRGIGRRFSRLQLATGAPVAQKMGSELEWTTKFSTKKPLDLRKWQEVVEILGDKKWIWAEKNWISRAKKKHLTKTK